MQSPSKSSKSRLKGTLIFCLILIVALVLRLGYLQIVKGEELKKGALEQWRKSIDIKPKRGVIYDRNGKKLAVSVNAYTVWATPADVKENYKDDKNIKDVAKSIAEVLDLEEEGVYEKITRNRSNEKIKQWITKEEAEELRKLSLKGISIVEDNKRYYPNGDFASHILGFTDIDNNGLYGIERVYDEELTGIPGKWVRMTDAANRQLPYDGEKVYDPTDGTSVVLTIDETIQRFAEKAAQKALFDNKAKGVSIIAMDPKTGDILAMVTLPDYDPNNPREPLDEDLKSHWKNLPQEELMEKWNEQWRNFAINDIYEPGSTFKIFTAAAALEENTATLDSHYYCPGTIKVSGRTLKCAQWYNPHESQSFKEAMENSCNVAYVNIGRQLGKENLYKYIKAFGFGEKTGIDLLGEQRGIIPINSDVIKEINLATMSYGHGIAVTPIQLATAVSAISNGGDLMEPRIVKGFIDNDSEEVKEKEISVKRKVISKETSDTMLSLLESVVKDGTGSRAYIPGYRIGGKTGTAQKIIDGRYAKGKYIGSFVAVAPIEDPQIVISVIVDEPGAGYNYGSITAAPAAKSILEDTFNYLEIPPKYTEEEKEMINQKTIVPDVRNKVIGEAGETLTKSELRYTTEYLELTNDSIVIDQFPIPGTEVQKGSIIDLYINSPLVEKTMMPYLIGKTKEEVITILNDMNLSYELEGSGKAISQNPLPGEELDGKDINIIVKFEEEQ